MRTSTRDRLLLPILLPVGILLLLAAVLFGFSRILLSLTKDAATATALVVAFSVLVVAAIAASRAVVRASSLASMLGAIAGVAMLAGGLALVAVGAKETGGAGGPAATLELVAKNTAFQPTSLSAPAGKPFAIEFDNQDPATKHNVQIFDNAQRTGTPLFDGQIVTGPATVVYRVQSLGAGTYYFHCVVHPAQMQGTIKVAGAPPGGGGGGGGPSVTVSAQSLAFDTKEIDLPANTSSTIHFENNDPGFAHDIAIYTDSTLSTKLFAGQIITGPATADYRVPPLQPGTFYFRCDVHPTMNGSVVVKAAPGGGGGGPSG